MKIDWQKTVRYGLAIVAFLVMVELSARVDDWIRYDAPLVGTYDAHLLRTWDDEGIRINIPGGHFEKWKNNSHGFRGPECAVEKKEGVKRIICLGASESYGLYESPEKEWPTQLREMLNPDSFEVINAATVGLPMTQYVAYLEKYVKKFSPDIVILYIEPTSYVAARQRKINNPEKEMKQHKQVTSTGFTLSSVKKCLRTLPKLQRAIKQFFPESIMAKYNRKDAVKKVTAAEQRYLNRHEPLDSVPDECLAAYRKDLGAIIDYLRSHEMQVILSTYPSLLRDDKIDDYFTTYMEGRRFVVELSLAGMIKAVEQINDENRKVADSLGIHFIDMEKIIPADKKYFADNVHYTDAGAEKVASAMAEYIKESF